MIFSITMDADYSFYVKTIETHARSFFKVIIFSIGSVITYLSWFENGFRFCDFFRGLISDLFAAGSVKHAEEVVVGTGHNGGIVAVPTALEFVKDAIVLIQRAQLRPQILVNLKKELSL